MLRTKLKKCFKNLVTFSQPCTKIFIKIVNKRICTTNVKTEKYFILYFKKQLILSKYLKI